MAGLSAAGALAQAQVKTPRSQSLSPSPADTRWARSAARKREFTKGVSWPDHEPINFLLRRGTHFEDQAEIYERQHDPGNIRKMAEAGVRYGRLHFYKGFGLQYEKPDIDKTRLAAALMHEHGMKVSLYVAGTLFIESFYREMPEAEQWEQRDQNNRPVPYMQTQTFRHYACPNDVNYRVYLKKVVRMGVQDIKADQIFFDNVQLQPEPKSCRCQRCVRGFHAFLKRRYPTREAAMRRFGLPDVEWIRVNEWDTFNTPDSFTAVDDPVIQEWIRFRCEAMARHYNELYDYIKSLNPAVSVGFNLKGIYGFNRMWLNGVYHSDYAGKCDFLPFDVHGMEARLDKQTGALISEIRSYKLGRTLEMSCDDDMQDELNAAVRMAFNYQKLVPGFGVQGGPFLQGGFNAFTPIMEFFREYNDRYLTGTTNIADVAVLRNWPSMAYSIGPTLVPAILMEQVLIQHRVPFDILYEEQMDRIGRYRAIVLPGQECLSSKHVEALLSYARNGGTLIFTGNTGQFNEWRERRRSNPLASRMERTDAISARNEGKGKLVYIPAILQAGSVAASEHEAENPEIVASSDQKNHQLPPQQWVLPRNHQDIFRAIVDNLAGGLSVESEAPLITVMEVLNRQETRESILQFVNFDLKNPVLAIPVVLKAQFNSPVKSVVCYSPDSDAAIPVRFQQSDGRISFTVPATRVYSMIVLAHG
jgi:hypothetical protein